MLLKYKNIDTEISDCPVRSRDRAYKGIPIRVLDIFRFHVNHGAWSLGSRTAHRGSRHAHHARVRASFGFVRAPAQPSPHTGHPPGHFRLPLACYRVPTRTIPKSMPRRRMPLRSPPFLILCMPLPLPAHTDPIATNRGICSRGHHHVQCGRIHRQQHAQPAPPSLRLKQRPTPEARASCVSHQARLW